MQSKEKMISLPEGAVFDSLGDAALIIDRDYNVLCTNPLFREAFPQNSGGSKCYHFIGREMPCQICTCSMASKKHTLQEKEDRINDASYLVSSRVIPRSSFGSFVYLETFRDISYNRHLEESLRAKNVILKNNLDIARQIQQSLLPQPLNTVRIKMSYKYIPCEELGGDFFNLYHIDEDSYGIFMADVSGHGVSAAMLTMFLNASYSRTCKSPSRILHGLFNEFNEKNFLKNQYIAIFYAVIDTKKRTLKYCNAGLNSYPVIYDGFSGKFKLIESSGFPVSNWVDSPEYTDTTILIDPGWKILFYTDGITEAKNALGNPYGTERLIRSLTEGNQSSGITLDRMVSYLEDFLDDSITRLKDDVTIVILELG